MFYVYLYRDPNTKAPMYVGKGSGTRAYSHLRKCHNPVLRGRLKAIKESGEQPIVEFLAKDLDEELAFLVEQEAIAKWGRKDKGTGCLFNHSDGGDGVRGSIWTDERRRLTGLAHKGVSPPNKGLTSSPEVKAKVSTATKAAMKRPAVREKFLVAMAARQGRSNPKIAETNSKPCTIDGTTVFKSRKDLAIALGQGKNGSRSPNFRYIENKQWQLSAPSSRKPFAA